MRKVAGYDYPYKVWPDDYPHESLYPDSVVTEIATKHKFQDLPLLRSILVRAAMFYLGYKDSHSPGSPTDSSIRREIKDLHARTEKYLAQLKGISCEAFEAMAWELCSPNVPPHDVPSHFEQRAFYEDQNISKPTIEEFYTDHTGYAKLGNLQQELQSLLDAAADVLNEMAIAKASVATHSFFTPIKGDGPKRLAYNKFIEILAIHWENTGHGKPPVYGKEGEPNAFLSFAYDAIFPIKRGKDEVATRKALYRAMENYLARRHPSEFS